MYRRKERAVPGSRWRRICAVAIVVGVAAGAVFAAPSTARAPSVGIKGSSLGTYAFKPKKLTVNKGATVNWSWKSNAPHNVTFRKLGKHSKTGAKGSYRLKFKHRGTFRYVCTVHGFTGKIVVK